MQVNNVSGGYSDPTAHGRQAELLEAIGKQPSSTQSIGSSVNRPMMEMANILSRYDVTDISPAEFSQMVQKLFDSGTISERELQELAAIRHDLDVEGVDPDDSLDLLEFFAQKIKKTQYELSDQDGPRAGQVLLRPLLGHMQWLEKFALVQSSPEAVGLDAMV